MGSIFLFRVCNFNYFQNGILSKKQSPTAVRSYPHHTNGCKIL